MVKRGVDSTLVGVEWKCPKCGGHVEVSHILTYPPITCFRCSSCDYHHDDHPEIKRTTGVAPE